MRWAVCPVVVVDQPRQTSLDELWIDKVMRQILFYWRDMSRGRENLEYRVFGWASLGLTLAEKSKLSQPELGDAGRKAIADANPDVDLGAYDNWIVLLDDSVSTLGVTNPHPLIGAVSANPAIFAHEMGHVYAVSHHANLAVGAGDSEYDDNFCIMGREGQKYSFVEPTCVIYPPVLFNPQPQTQWAMSGPGMCAPFLSAAGWLDFGDPAATADISEGVGGAAGAAIVELQALHRTSQVDVAPRCALVRGLGDEHDRLVIELRTAEGWDRALPGGGGIGWIVVHGSSGSGKNTTSTQIGSCRAQAGGSLRVARAPMRLDVVSVDASAGTVVLRVSHDGWRPWYMMGSANLAVFNQTARVAAVAQPSTDRMEVFAVGQDRGIRGRRCAGWTWETGWEVIGQGAYNDTAGLAAVARTANQTDLFAVGTDGIVRRLNRTDGTWSAGWEMLDGAAYSQTAGFAAVAIADQEMAVFAVGEDGVIRGRRWNAGSWAPGWEVLDGAAFSQTAGLAAVARSPDEIAVFAVGRDDGVIRGRWCRSGVWDQGWEILGGAGFTQTAGIAAMSRSADELEVFATGQDGIIRGRRWSNGAWLDSWEVVDGAAFDQTAGLAAIATSPENAEIFALGQDGVIRGRRNVNWTWAAGWEVIGDRSIQFSQTARLAAVSPTADTMHLFGIAPDGLVHGRSFSDAAGWADGWEALDGAGFTQTAGLATAALSAEALAVFAMGEDGVIRGRRWNAGSWAPGWEVLDGTGFTQTAGLAALAFSADELEVFAVGEDGVIRGRRWNAGSWAPGWEVLDGAGFTPAVALAGYGQPGGGAEIFAVGQDGVIRGRRFRNNAWLPGWELLTGAAFNQTAGLAALARSPQRQEVFAVGQDGYLRGMPYWLR